MNVKKLNILYILTAFVLAFGSCGKENQQIDYNVGVLASQEYVESQQMMNLLLNTYFKSITDSLLIIDHQTEIDGAIVTYSDTPEERLVIYYPDWGCEDDCGHIRAGTITATPGTGFYDSLDVIRFDFEDFQYDRDDVFVSGMTVTNLGRMDGIHYAYKIMANSVQRIYADTTKMTQFTMDQTFVLYKDPASIFYSQDDYFRIHGFINGTSSTGKAYSASINDQEYILDQFSCRWAKQGPATLNFDSETYGSFILFPGADTCLNKYAVDIDGNPFYYPFD